jgi:hypothetical protein
VKVTKRREGTARKVRDETRSLVRLHLVAVGSAIAVFGLAGAAAVHAMLFGKGGSGLLQAAFSWGSLALAAWAAALWLLRGRGGQVDGLVRENLILGFPRSRKDLEPWLSKDLAGPRAELAAGVIERRLDRQLAGAQHPGIRRGYFPAMLLVLSGLLLLASIHVLFRVPPARGIEGFLRGFLALGAPQDPPAIVDLSLRERWIGAKDLEEVSIEFDHPLREPGKLIVRAGGITAAFPLDLVEGARYRARPGRRTVDGEGGDPVALQAAVGRWTSPEETFRVIPDRPVRMTEVSLFDDHGGEIGKFPAERSPFQVPEGGVAIFRIETSPCPLAALGIAGQKCGEIPLKEVGSGAYVAEVPIVADETVRAFWQVPGSPARFGDAIDFRALAAPVPDVRLLVPEEGDRTGTRILRVSCRSRHPGPIERGLVLCSDYGDLQGVWEAPVERRGDEWRMALDLPLSRLGLPSGRVLGVAAALSTGGKAPRIGISRTANVLLPERLLQVARAGGAGALADGRDGTEADGGDAAGAEAMDAAYDGEAGEAGSDDNGEGQASAGSESGARGKGATGAKGKAGPKGEMARGTAAAGEAGKAEPRDGERPGERVASAAGAKAAPKTGPCPKCGGT